MTEEKSYIPTTFAHEEKALNEKKEKWSGGYKYSAEDVAHHVDGLKARFTAFKLYSREEILKEIKEEFGDLQ